MMRLLTSFKLKFSNVFNVKVNIQIYGKDITDEIHSPNIISQKIVAYTNSHSMSNYFYANHFGFLYFDEDKNVSLPESFQIRKRVEKTCYFMVPYEVDTETVDRIVKFPLNFKYHELRGLI